MVGRRVDLVGWSTCGPPCPPTARASGGPDLTTAYITVSGTGRLMAHEWHCPGNPLNFLNT